MTGPRPIDLGNPVADHPLNRGRVMWLLPVPAWSAGVTWQDLCKRSTGTLAGGAAWDGNRVSVAANAHRVEYAPSSGGSTSWSILLDAEILTGTADSGAVLGRAYNVGEGYAYFRTGAGAGQSYLDYYESGSLRFATAAGSVLRDVRTRILVVRAGTTCTIYSNGVSVGSGTMSVASSLSGNQLRVGQDTGGSNAARMRVYGVSVWDRALSASETVAEYDQSRRGYPDLLRRYTPRFYHPAPSAGGPIAPTGIGSTSAFGQATVSAGPVTIAATGIAPTGVLGSAAVTQGAMVSATGIASGEAFGSAAVSTGALTITAQGLAPTVAFGSPAVTTGTASVIATGIAPTAAVGSPTANPGPVSVSATGLPAASALGSATVSAGTAADLVVVPSIESDTAFGTAAITPGPVAISTAGLPPGSAIGAPIIYIPAPASGTRTVRVAAENRFSAVPAETRTYRVAA